MNPGAPRSRYTGRPELAEPAAWSEAFAGSLAADRARGITTIGPHRDDVALAIDGQPLRVFGSTGQLRSAAIALKLLELATLRERRGIEPALLLDDVFAELDSERQRRLATRLMADGRAPALRHRAAGGRTAAAARPAAMGHGCGPGHRPAENRHERRRGQGIPQARAGTDRRCGSGLAGSHRHRRRAWRRPPIIVDWPRLVGEQIAAVTEAESITPDGLLRVRVATAAWANELSLMTPQIIARLNAGRQGRIRGIRWIATGPGTRPSP